MTLTVQPTPVAPATLLTFGLPEAGQRMLSEGVHPSLVIELFRGQVRGQEVRGRLFEAFVAAHGELSREAATAKADRIMALFNVEGVDRENLSRHVGYSPHKIGPIPDKIAARVSGMTAAEVHETEWSREKSFHPAYHVLGPLFGLSTWWVCETLQALDPNSRRSDLTRVPAAFAGATLAAGILAQLLAALAFEAAHPEVHPGLAWELFA